MRTRLDSDEAHLWLAPVEAIRDPELLRACEALLSPEEKEKKERFYFEKDRHLCLVSRALVRTALSRYQDVPPEAWRFTANRYGRPEIAAPPSPLRFNVSHTRGLVACLVASEREVGVDVENRERSGELLDVADRYFSPFEVAALRRLPASDRLDRFFLYWTLKESYIKARGMGLAIPLSRFSFDLDGAAGGIHLLLDPRLEDDAESWQFSIFNYGRSHYVAASLRRRPGEQVRLKVEETPALVPAR